MKRITKMFLTIAVVLFAGSAFAQDMTQATELYQKATEAYQAGNELEAVAGFKEALKIANEAGEDGVQMVEECKNMIPQILMAAAGKSVAAKDYAKAEEIYTEAYTLAKEYGNESVAENAQTKLAQVALQGGADALNSGKFDEAVSHFKKAIERDDDNATAYLYLGMAQGKLNKIDEAEAALLKAKELGNDKAATILSQTLVSSANEALKANKLNDAIAIAEKALALGANPTASQIAGMAAYKAKSWAKAANHLKNAPASAQTSYITASCFENAGNKAQACVFYKKVLNDAKFGPTAKQKIAKLGC